LTRYAAAAVESPTTNMQNIARMNRAAWDLEKLKSLL
jgi:hypothetical protein